MDQTPRWLEKTRYTVESRYQMCFVICKKKKFNVWYLEMVSWWWKETFSKPIPFLLAKSKAAATPDPTTGSSSRTAFSVTWKTTIELWHTVISKKNISVPLHRAFTYLSFYNAYNIFKDTTPTKKSNFQTDPKNCKETPLFKDDLNQTKTKF